MAIIRALQPFDMRGVVPGGASLSVAPNVFALTAGNQRTVLTGSFSAGAAGATGTVLAMTKSVAGSLVFEASGLERSASTIADILADRDNDRLFAYTLSGADQITGSGGADYLIGFGGDDLIRGGAGSDQLFGGAGRDTVDGGLGADFIAGGLDIDLMRGGGGNDTYLVAEVGDRVVEARAEGQDTILSYVTVALPAHVERLVLIGAAAINGRGSLRPDDIDGNDAANRLTGDAGDDRLDGDGGADVLEGGGGRDALTGGAGADVFQFRSAADAYGDRIVDFTRGVDRVHLAHIDADPGLAGDQAFRFVGNAGLTGRPGDLATSGAWLQGDLDGDRVADFVIRFENGVTPTLGDLIL